jgi:hypothetical protein
MLLRAFSRRQLRELRDGPHGGTIAPQWQGDLTRRRRRERSQPDWTQLMLKEAVLLELELRNERQLA